MTQKKRTHDFDGEAEEEPDDDDPEDCRKIPSPIRGPSTTCSRKRSVYRSPKDSEATRRRLKSSVQDNSMPAEPQKKKKKLNL